MKKQLESLIILLICYETLAKEADCSDFEAIIQTECAMLSKDEYCFYIDNKCQQWFEKCEDYSPKENFDNNTCLKIIPHNNKKKCTVKVNEENERICTEVDKQCIDYHPNKDDDCSELKANRGKRCVLFNGECKEHFDYCTETELNEETKCVNNIPKSKDNICVWKDSGCVPELRKCKDFKVYNDINGGNKPCNDLNSNTDPNAVCYLDENNNCIEGYQKCEDIKDAFLSKCNEIIPLNDENNLIKCMLESSTCKTKYRICNDNFKRDKDTNDTCKLLSPQNQSHKGYKKCYLNGNTCEENFISCESFNDVFAENERDPNVCNSLKIYRDTTNDETINERYKCNFNTVNKKCEEIPISCNEIKNEEICNKHSPKDQNKKCLFKNNNCIEIYKDCDTYDTIVPAADKKKSDCEQIRPWKVEGYNQFYKCIFDDDNPEDKYCDKKKIEKCEDYEGKDEEFCHLLSSVLNNNDLNCIIRDGKCVEEYKECEKYHGKNKTKCESIIIYNEPYYRCFFENDQNCKKERRLCSEYFGKDKDECSKNYRASQNNKECVFESDKCIEKYKEELYQYCSDYKGTDKLICESIKPYNGNKQDYYSKCEYTSEGCEKVPKECKEAKDINECNNNFIIPSNPNKICVFKNNECVEQYRTCNLYKENEKKINRETCESIIIDNDYTHKCVFQQGTTTTEDDCIAEERKCQDFNLDLVGSKCSAINLSDKTKKCIFKNNICTSVKKTCLDLENFPTATKELCEAAEAYSEDKICVLKSDENGCEEINNPDYVEKTRDKKNSSGKIYMNKIIFLLVFFYVLVI